MVNVPPPLLCSTPPPIDFGEEDDDSGLQSTLNLDEADDEFSDYSETQRMDMVANDKVSLPHLMPDLEIPQTDFAARPPDPDNCVYVSCITPPPLATITTDIKPKNLKPPPVVEAFNYNVTHNFSLNAQETQDFGSFQQQLDNDMPSSDIIESNDVDVDGDEEEEATNNDNVPSLKLDSLSLYSSGSGSVSSATLSPAMPLDDLEVKQETKLCGGGGIVHQVTLEDVSDDSCDDDYSPKKRKSLIVNEDSEDFFAIHIVDDTLAPKIGKHHIIMHNHHHEKGESGGDKDEMQIKVEILKSAIDANDRGFAAFQTTDLESKAMTHPSSAEVAVINDNQIVGDDDFGDFADFSLANQAEQTTVPVVNQTTFKAEHVDMNKVNDSGGDNDDFDDFQDFATASSNDVDVSTVPKPPGQIINSKTETKNDTVKADGDDDDDFGDFSEVSFASAAPSETKPNIIKTVVPPPPPPAATNISITERVKPVLEMMFPSTTTTKTSMTTETSHVPTIKDNMHFKAIEQAKALNYQWTNSEMRFALIRSLGIDSRNILFCEKWNSNMPRFAANLSFDPIKPMKSQTAAAGGSTIMNTTSSSSTPSSSAAAGLVGSMSGTTMLNPTTIMSADDFDWKNGSVNPMSGTDTIQSTGTEIETKSGEFYGRQQEQHQEEQFIAANDEIIDDDIVMVKSQDDDKNNDDANHSNRYEPPNDDATTKTSAHVIATTATTISSTLPTDSNGHGLDNIEQHPVQQNFNLNEELTKGLNDNNYNKTTTTATAATTFPVDMTTVGGLMMVNNSDTNILCHSNHVGGFSLAGSDQYNLVGDLAQSQPTAMPAMPAMTMTTTTYNVPLKETHIFTPSKSDTAIAKTTTPPIDFDYEIASAGIIIDETVVKKEYRDIEYNPPYDLEVMPTMIKPPSSSSSSTVANIYLDPPELKEDDGVDDDFSDFQSVPIQKPHDHHKIVNNSVTAAPAFGDQMILSPAILLPQAMSLTAAKKSKPSIEWGESANTNINADELARIEELFPQPKISGALGKSKENSNQGSPVHQQQQEHKLPQAPTISAAVAQNHAEGGGGGDDDWSDFVSVPITSSNGVFGNQQTTKKQQFINNNNNNNNGNTKTAKLQQSGRMIMMMNSSPNHHKLNVLPPTKASTNTGSGGGGAGAAASSVDADEWSDFVSSAPPVSLSQFNSSAWQKANFYNNPMSLYQHNQQHQHAQHSNLVSNSLASTKYQHNNNNNNYNKHNNNYNRNHNNLNANKSNLQQKQQIHIMHDFSTAPTAETSHQQQIYQQQHHHYTQQLQQQQQQQRNNPQQQQHQHQQSSGGQFGKAKVAPRISLIPDLSFMAPAVPTNAGAFMSSLPKPSFSAKK